MRILLVLVLACAGFAARAQTHEVPSWFAESFLEFPQDVKEAAQEHKRLMLYFWQDGCPACRKMKETTLADQAIVHQTRRRFVAVALNVYGERELQWTDGRAMREKELARALNIRGTPTLLFLDEKGSVVLRLVGYVPPERFLAALAEAKTR
ncbi:MAG: thioredoxin family protein [Burkholderiales bacterium]